MLKLGVIGISEGNGHPYSWSAIFNGYDPVAMADCAYPVIPEYLSKQTFPDACIPGAQVTHIWTQERGLSEHIAKAALIPNLVEQYKDMIGEVDAVLLARDDAENHYAMSKVFLDAGIPLFIDKPLAYSITEAKRILELKKHSYDIFTCSALRYAEELYLSPEEKEVLGELKRIYARIPKNWKNYSIHIIDPVLNYLNDDDGIVSMKRMDEQDSTQVSVEWQSGLITTFDVVGAKALPMEIRLYGSKSTKILMFEDTFSAFKNSLMRFLRQIEERRLLINDTRTLKAIRIVEAGC